MKSVIIYCAAFLVSIIPASAQEIWNLKKCLDIGMKNNLDFKLGQLEVLSAETTHRNAAMEFLPSIGFNAAHNYSIGSTIDPATNSRVSSNIQSDDFSINTSMDVINFNNFTTARRNKIAVLKAKADKEAIANEYALTILENYFNVIYTQEQLHIQQRQFENADFNRNRVKKETEIGSRPQSDFYDMQVSYAQEENTMTETIQLLYNQKLKLLQLMNVTDTKPYEMVLEQVVSARTMSTNTELYAYALQNNPKINAAQLSTSVFMKNVAIQKNNFLPVVTANYSYSSFYYLPVSQPGVAMVDPFWNQFNNNKNHFISLRLAVPIFNGLKTRRDVQLSKIEYEKSIVVVEQEKISVRQTIEAETARREQSLDFARKLAHTKTTAQKSFETTQSKFTSGLVDAFVFTASKNQLLNAEYQLLKAHLTADYLSLKLHLLAYNTLDLDANP